MQSSQNTPDTCFNIQRNGPKPSRDVISTRLLSFCAARGAEVIMVEKHTPGEITESQIEEISLVLQGADQDSELVVLTKSAIEEPSTCGDCNGSPCTCDSEEGESEEATLWNLRFSPNDG